MQLCFALPNNVMCIAQLCRMDSRSLRVTQNAYLSLLTRTKELFLVIFYDVTKNLKVRMHLPMEE